MCDINVQFKPSFSRARDGRCRNAVTQHGYVTNAVTDLMEMVHYILGSDSDVGTGESRLRDAVLWQRDSIFGRGEGRTDQDGLQYSCARPEVVVWTDVGRTFVGNICFSFSKVTK